MKEYKLSDSRMGTYQSCPFKYQKKYIEGIKEGPVQGYKLQLGSAVHYVIEQYVLYSMNCKGNGNGYMLAKALKELKEALLLCEICEGVTVANRISISVYKLLDMLKEKYEELQLDGFEIMSTEMGLSHDNFFGIVDLVATYKGELLVIDFKTGAKVSDYTGKSQAKLYSHAINESMGIKPDKFIYALLIYTKEPKIELQEVVVDDKLIKSGKDMCEYYTKVIELSHSLIEQGIDLPTCPNIFCGSCGYAVYCGKITEMEG
jgi:ATP-dependent helicase/DNAse subunit B